MPNVNTCIFIYVFVMYVWCMSFSNRSCGGSTLSLLLFSLLYSLFFVFFFGTEEGTSNK